MYIDKPDETLRAIASAAGYSGRRFKLEPCAEMTLTGRYWDSGERTTWTLHDFSTGRAHSLNALSGFSDPPQFGGLSSDPTVKIPRGMAIAGNHSGRYSHLRVYANAEDLAPLLAPPSELSDHEAIVLIATASLKSSYEGRPIRRIAAAKNGVDAAAWEEASTALRARKLLNAAGAITAAGRNAVASHPMRNRLRS
jgi:hypothetical protein